MLMMTGIDIWEDFVKFVYRKSGLTGKDLWNEVTEIAEILVVKFYIFIFQCLNFWIPKCLFSSLCVSSHDNFNIK